MRSNIWHLDGTRVLYPVGQMFAVLDSSDKQVQCTVDCTCGSFGGRGARGGGGGTGAAALTMMTSMRSVDQYNCHGIHLCTLQLLACKDLHHLHPSLTATAKHVQHLHSVSFLFFSL